MNKILPVAVLAAAGIGVSVVIQVVHGRLTADVNYASFCNVSTTVNCDVVLSSPYATFAGVSVALWALAYYVGMLGLVIGAAAVHRASMRETLATLVFAAATWGLLFSVYMAVIAFGLLHAVCLMCSALYFINIAAFLAAWRLRTAVRASGHRRAAARADQDRMVLVGSIAAVVLLVAIGSWEAFGRGSHALDAADVARQRPDFYSWYLAQPMAQAPLDGGRNVRGSADAPVTVVEFSDFECGHCAAFHNCLDEVLRRAGKNVRVVFRHFPLDSSCNPSISTQLHPFACLAAVAAECAGEQGKFWQYHNMLFAHQHELGREFLIRYAERLGMDVARFTNCLGDAAAQDRVRADTEEGARLGIDSTPTIFINGRMIKGALAPDLLADALILARPTP